MRHAITTKVKIKQDPALIESEAERKPESREQQRRDINRNIEGQRQRETWTQRNTKMETETEPERCRSDKRRE